MEKTVKYKIVGDVYEVDDDGTLVLMPKQKVLSRMAYKHEQYLVVEREKNMPRNVTGSEVFLWLGVGIISVTFLAGLWAHFAGWFL